MSQKITSPERTSRDCLLIRFSEIPFKPSLDRHSFADSRESDSEKIRRALPSFRAAPRAARRRAAGAVCAPLLLFVASESRRRATRVGADARPRRGGARGVAPPHPLARHDARVAVREAPRARPIVAPRVGRASPTGPLAMLRPPRRDFRRDARVRRLARQGVPARDGGFASAHLRRRLGRSRGARERVGRALRAVRGGQLRRAVRARQRAPRGRDESDREGRGRGVRVAARQRESRRVRVRRDARARRCARVAPVDSMAPRVPPRHRI